MAITVIAAIALLVPAWSCLAEEAKPVRSLLEARRALVVIQAWDLSCGAAALATLLNYQHGDPISEREIALGMVERTEYLENPDLIKWREGFSLLDFQRFVEARGYRGLGLGRLTLDHLIERAPIIVPIDAHGYQHFVVFRGALEDRVLLADPAFGNRTMTREAFERAWLDFEDIGRVGFIVERRDTLIPPNRLMPKPEEFLALR